MSGLDMQASLHNLTQADRLQQEAQKAPLAHQSQSAEKVRQDAAQRLNMPTQPDTVEKKDPDARHRKRLFFLGKKRKKKKKDDKKSARHADGDGFFIDYSA
jgi:hypothetical protein